MMEKNYRHINKDIHYFCLMQPVRRILGVAFTNSSDAMEWFECYVDETQYEVDDNYKITLRDINNNAYEHYYQDDFLSLMHEGFIVPKTNDDIHVEHVDFYEPIPNSIACLHHEGQMLVGTFHEFTKGDCVRIGSCSFLCYIQWVDKYKKVACVQWKDDEDKVQTEIYSYDELTYVP